MNTTLLLRNCRLFADLDAAELRRVETIATRRDLRKGQLLFREGEKSRGFWIVAAGTIKVFRLAPDGRERVMHVIGPGESFAEAAMFMDEYPAHAEALTPVTVVGIEKNGFKQLLARDAKLNFKIIGSLVAWLNLMRNSLTDLTLKDVPARFASYVLSLPGQPGQPLKVATSKTTIAQMIGTTKETFSRLLNRLARANVLAYRGKQINILDRTRLKAIAEGKERI